MARIRGRARRGERCTAAIPHGHWNTTTFTAGLRLDGIAAPMLLPGPMDGDAFRAYVEKVLVPELNPGDTVIMDNLPAHKVSGIREMIEAAQARLLYPRPRRCQTREASDRVAPRGFGPVGSNACQWAFMWALPALSRASRISPVSATLATKGWYMR